MAYSADYTLSQSAAFQQQVQMSTIKTAQAVASEAFSSKGAYAKRHALATQVLSSQTTTPWLMMFVNAAIEAGALVSGATDAQVDTAVSAAWNGIAGVTAADLT